jgi:hypothetical protein
MFSNLRVYGDVYNKLIILSEGAPSVDSFWYMYKYIMGKRGKKMLPETTIYNTFVQLS